MRWVHPLQHAQCVPVVFALDYGTLLLFPVGQKDGEVLRLDACRGEDVAQGARGFNGSVGFLPSLACLLDFRGGRIGNPPQATKRFCCVTKEGLGVHLEEGHPALLQDIVELTQLPDANQGVAVDEVAVKQREWKPRHEGVNPDAQPSQLHGNFIDVHAVDAAAGDEATEESVVLELFIGVGCITQCLRCRRAKVRNFLSDLG